jgi:CubicO group peptidase (beta-lactamase class C family)
LSHWNLKMKASISGEVGGVFEPVADAFATVLASDGAMGAALSIYLDGRPVVDLWGGCADARTHAPWTRETANVLFSCTKGLMSILAAQLVQAGRLDYDAPVSEYWPEFARAGKEETRVRHLLSHQAGLSALHVRLTTEDILDWERMIGILEEQRPLWPPGRGHAYHALTHGWLVGELIRRVTGKSAGEQFAEAVAGPLDADAWIGLPQSENGRVAYLTVGDSLARQVAADDEASWSALATTLGDALPAALAGPGSGFNDPRLWQAQIPGAGGIADARSLARIWSATVCDTAGKRLLGDEIGWRATQPQSQGEPIIPVPPPWSRWGMGFQLDSPARRYLTARGFGHDGAGGQVAFAEPDLKLGFAFITNLMEGIGDNRATSIVDALRAIVAPAP